MTEQLLDEMRDALATAYAHERAGNHKMAHAYGSLAARRIEEALSQGYGDNDQFQVRGDLVRVPSSDVRPTQADYA